ncbi:hypothetical protein FB451DRAFT_1267578 [Mycena latifolia]|nr:hypothetical protein FB451DRAFT_1267578 [Mycena latifolia]
MSVLPVLVLLRTRPAASKPNIRCETNAETAAGRHHSPSQLHVSSRIALRVGKNSVSSDLASFPKQRKTRRPDRAL